MSTLKVNKLRDTTGSTDAIVLDPSGGAVLAGVTTISTARITTGITTSIQVGGGVTISESGIEASGIGITCASINGTQIGGRRNIIINGAMNVAQHGTSFTTNDSFSVDRFQNQYSGVDVGPTFAQVDVASGTSPYTNGFRKALKITNADQSSGAGTSDMMAIVYKFEAQDVANSGWNYTSASSFITLSYWVKSSVAQNFYGRFQSLDGTSQNYPFETGSLTADTWTKITNTIPGNSNLQFDNDVNHGLTLELSTFRGTDKTGSVSLNAWAAYGGGTTRTPDQTSTWYTTNGATFEITGVQLEVGPQATPFEHRSYQQEIELCYRYYYKLKAGTSGFWGAGVWYNSTSFICFIAFPVVMRTNVTAVEQSGTASHYKVIANATTYTCNSVPTYGGDANNSSQTVGFPFSSGPSQGQSGIARSGSADSYLAWSAEL